MRMLNYIAIFNLFGTSAYAEVCDKVRSNWRPKDGPVGQLGELYYFFTGPGGLFLLGLSGIVLFINRRWVSVSLAAFLAIITAYIGYFYIWPIDRVSYLARIEGCTSHPLSTIVVLLLIAAFFALHGRKRITQRLNTVNLSGDLDDIEILMDIEKTYKIKIEDSEAETTYTVGDLYDLVQLKLKEQSNVDQIWSEVCQIVREHSRTVDPIDRETSFFKEHAREREPWDN